MHRAGVARRVRPPRDRAGERLSWLRATPLLALAASFLRTQPAPDPVANRVIDRVVATFEPDETTRAHAFRGPAAIASR